jgi:lysophospholipase L1-like esterase
MKWATDTRITTQRSHRRHALRKAVAVIVYNLVMAFVLIETSFVVMLHVPRLTALTPTPFRRLIQQVYRHFNRSLIQFDSHCARYDPAVSYTLQPGSCTFENVEFRNVYRINHAGLRDEQAALDSPDVIVVGDSHAMGWGVEQDEAIPQLLARKTGLKVLNAAVSSYGTAREMLLLDRLDTSRLGVLVVQYSDNDLLENRAFQQTGGRLPIMSEAQYQNIVRHYASQRSYYPGKYLYRLFMKITRLESPEPDQTRMEPVSASEEAELFVNVLIHAAHARLDAVQIVVFEINEQIRPAPPFIAALESVKLRERNPEFIRRLKTVDVATLLSPDDFYVLDDHMNRRGHEAVASALAAEIRKHVRSTVTN